MILKKINNAFTVDVEDFFQVEAFSNVIDRKKWGSYACRVELNTNLILDLLDENNIKGTFFVLGWIAKRYPGLVKKIDARGHEIASHGMSHKLIYKQSIDEFRAETVEAKKLLEDIIQKNVYGYRAATYSITKKSLWALDILVEAGFIYDSSIFPIRHDRYGIHDACHVPNILTTPNQSKIIEFPLSVIKTKYLTLPIAGGGYFRLFPYWFTKLGLKTLNKKGQEFVFYIHPWEVDPEQPVVQTGSKFTQFRHYNNISKCADRLKRLTTDFYFTSMKDVLQSKGLISVD